MTPFVRRPTHRCPECWKPLQSAEAVDLHRAEWQGECFDTKPLTLRNTILNYRLEFQIPKLPMPEPLYDDEVLIE